MGSGIRNYSEIIKKGGNILKRVKLREIAHARAGEKLDDVTLSVIAYCEEDYELLKRQVTINSVRKLYGSITKGEIRRYEVPNIGALNFVLGNTLEGGRTRTLAFEESGKSLSSIILRMNINVPNNYITRSEEIYLKQSKE